MGEVLYNTVLLPSLLASLRQWEKIPGLAVQCISSDGIVFLFTETRMRVEPRHVTWCQLSYARQILQHGRCFQPTR
jgi:hypothetical protein